MDAKEIGCRVESFHIPPQVTLIAVSKRKPIEFIRAAYTAGLRDFGENYIQDAVPKIQALQGYEGIRWHFIGHLQSNKSKLAAQHFDVIQTVDSGKLAKKINAECQKLKKKIDILVEVNIGNEPQKAGVQVGELDSILAQISRLDCLQLKGLMCIPPNDAVSDVYFKHMQEIFALYQKKYALTELSMGMSSDFQAAIEYGATMVRIGTALFGPRE